ncbi:MULTISPECIES: hypothetical protein [Cyanophyceae]|uniref:hypothetical protein n=1 Tax=Cyanophyceae TaxID=3028117 RepID=UPI00168A33A8|nr:hypothetical protein [Trichocoleus sp. FACHB-40]MBD2001988.1 hypothetical protein [Trichocoleus sp. FACHB-40]
MEYKPTPITIDKCFIEQQAFRDFLKLPSEEPAPKIGLRDLLEVTKLVIRNELVSCGCSEKELIKFQLEYQVSQDESQEPGEIYSVEWCQSPQFKKAIEDKNGITEEQPEVNLEENSPLSVAFIGKLTERLDEVLAASEKGRLTSTRLNFSSLENLNCEPDCAADAEGVSYQAILCNGKFSRWIYKRNPNGTKVKLLCPDKPSDTNPFI